MLKWHDLKMRLRRRVERALERQLILVVSVNMAKFYEKGR